MLGKLGLADVAAGDGEATAALGEARRRSTSAASWCTPACPVAGLDTPRPSLEDLFVGLTGEGFDVDG